MLKTVQFHKVYLHYKYIYIYIYKTEKFWKTTSFFTFLFKCCAFFTNLKNFTKNMLKTVQFYKVLFYITHGKSVKENQKIQ